MRSGSKYQPLQDYLRRSDQQVITLSFAEIEALMQEPLPTSARQQKAWWSNRSSGGLQSKAWMQADYLVKSVDLANEQVTFSKPPRLYHVEQRGDTVFWNGELIKAFRKHLKLSQTEFAELLGVNQATVSQWENNVYQPTRATSKYLSRVAEGCGFPYGQADGASQQ
ncbi:MAG: helix-turn-helix transcriptional regulator [Synechococcales cyanobacterium C42_A2020_086]|jgi:DNA-binding transcriptional regulator YiaG|nr:helix-turn-helix transcriptional regulator [Synechococcales cyanobacterium M58_A2018_015]MBF2072489.1 helix-turn-helix transcriptional regulator [Synechococcales cyanobacterium C42_A2020_086]